MVADYDVATAQLLVGYVEGFERVAGAHLRERGVPAAGLGLTDAWRTPAGREHRYRLMLPANAGLVGALLPYSSERPKLDGPGSTGWRRALVAGSRCARPRPT